MAQLRADANFRVQTQNGKVCPVCSNKKKYWYLGKEYECPNDDFGHPTLRLSMLYFLANIPLQYQQLVWSEWPTNVPERAEIKDDVEAYIEAFDKYQRAGVGVTFWSKALGTGKTWMATHILKELLKQGHDGWFVSFRDIKSYHERDDSDFYERRMAEAHVLVLDEVRDPWTENTKRFYGEKLEDLIRPRTNANLPTILTTNLLPEQLEEHYPRVFSLMSAKNKAIHMYGNDIRVSDQIWRRNGEVSLNEESFPIE